MGQPQQSGQPDLVSEGAGEHPPCCRCSSGNVRPGTSPQETMLTPSLLLFAQVAERALSFIKKTTKINPTKPMVENKGDFISCYSRCRCDLKNDNIHLKMLHPSWLFLSAGSEEASRSQSVHIFWSGESHEIHMDSWYHTYFIGHRAADGLLGR